MDKPRKSTPCFPLMLTDYFIYKTMMSIMKMLYWMLCIARCPLLLLNRVLSATRKQKKSCLQLKMHSLACRFKCGGDNVKKVFRMRKSLPFLPSMRFRFLLLYYDLEERSIYAKRFQMLSVHK